MKRMTGLWIFCLSTAALNHFNQAKKFGACIQPDGEFPNPASGKPVTTSYTISPKKWHSPQANNSTLFTCVPTIDCIGILVYSRHDDVWLHVETCCIETAQHCDLVFRSSFQLVHMLGTFPSKYPIRSTCLASHCKP